MEELEWDRELRAWAFMEDNEELRDFFDKIRDNDSVDLVVDVGVHWKGLNWRQRDLEEAAASKGKKGSS